jgi:hypothetical protein
MPWVTWGETIFGGVFLAGDPSAATCTVSTTPPSRCDSHGLRTGPLEVRAKPSNQAP